MRFSGRAGASISGKRPPTTNPQVNGWRGGGGDVVVVLAAVVVLVINLSLKGVWACGCVHRPS